MHSTARRVEATSATRLPPLPAPQTHAPLRNVARSLRLPAPTPTATSTVRLPTTALHPTTPSADAPRQSPARRSAALRTNAAQSSRLCRRSLERVRSRAAHKAAHRLPRSPAPIFGLVPVARLHSIARRTPTISATRRQQSSARRRTALPPSAARLPCPRVHGGLRSACHAQGTKAASTAPATPIRWLLILAQFVVLRHSARPRSVVLLFRLAAGCNWRQSALRRITRAVTCSQLRCRRRRTAVRARDAPSWPARFP